MFSKKIIALSLVFATMLIAGLLNLDSASAETADTYTEGGIIYTLDETGGSYTASASWDGSTSEVVVKSEVVKDGKTYAVKSLSAFSSNSIVTKVTINANNQLTLSDNTFKDNTALTEISLGEGIVELPVGFCTFTEDSSSNLTTVNLSNVTIINNSAFKNCCKLVSVDLSKTTTIMANAFNGCRALVDVTLSSDLEVIGDYAFDNCWAIQSISIPGKVLNVGTCVFRFCKNLTNINLDSEFKQIGDQMFSDCVKLESIDLKNVVGIGASAFRNCTALKQVLIPDTTKAIGTTAFENCTSLTSCNLGSNLESLGYQVFKNCPLITGTMYVPDSLTAISLMLTGISTFPSNISEIQVDSKNPTYASVDGILYDKSLENVLYCPGGRTGEVTISASVGEYAFAGCHISKITILDGAKTIGNVAFKAGTDPTLIEVVFPSSLESIGNTVFSGQTKLKSISLPSELGKIGTNMFNGLTSLEYVKFPDSSFTNTSANTFKGATFTFSDGSVQSKPTKNGTTDTLMGLRFVWNGTDANKFYQITDEQVLVTTLVDGVPSYRAISKGAAYAPADPTVEHKVFENWYADKEFTVLYDKAAALNSDTVIYAKTSPETHTVKYVIDGEVIGDVGTYEYGQEVSVREAYTKVGYTVGSWTSENVVPEEGKFLIGSEDIVFTAVCTVNQYTITFKSNGGSAVTAITQDYGTSVVAPENPTKTGYTFQNWTLNGVKYNFSTIPAENITLNAVWALNAVVDDAGKSEVKLDSETDSFIPAQNTKEISVEVGKDKSVSVADASELVGKTVVTKIESISNNTSIAGTAYEFTFTADGKEYTGKLQVTLPYTKESGKDPVVYFVNGSESTKMSVISNTDTSVTFETDHNSVYVVASEEHTDSGNSILLYVGILIVACIVIVAVGYNIHRKKA